jgi:hypothetical protein
MLNRTTVLLVACAAATATVAGGAAGQQAPPTVIAAAYSVHGTIVDTQGNPVGDAEVALLEGGTPSLYVRSDSGGHFGFDGLATASASVRVRRLGFQPRTVGVQITRTDRSASMFITLEAMAAKLDAVNIDDDTARTPNAMLAAFYERARTNSFGHYIDEASFAKMRPQWVSEAMRKVPGVVIKPTKRIGNMVRIRGCGVPGESPEAVGPLVWVDEVAQSADVAAVEIYNSYAGIPAQFFDRSAVCGTILVWTRSR